MSKLFFTKRVFRNDEPIGFCGVDLDEVARANSFGSSHIMLNSPDFRFRLWREYLLPALKDSLLWPRLHWLRFIVGLTDRYETRVSVYGRLDADDYSETYLWPLLQTRFVSFSGALHLAAFNRAWSLSSFSAPRFGQSWKIETVRRIESLNEDNFNLVVSDDYDMFYDFD